MEKAGKLVISQIGCTLTSPCDYSHGGPAYPKGFADVFEPFLHVPLTQRLGHKVPLNGNCQPLRGLLGAAHSTSALATWKRPPRGLLGANLASGVHQPVPKLPGFICPISANRGLCSSTSQSRQKQTSCKTWIASWPTWVLLQRCT